MKIQTDDDRIFETNCTNIDMEDRLNLNRYNSIDIEERLNLNFYYIRCNNLLFAIFEKYSSVDAKLV